MIDNKCLALLVEAWVRELRSELQALNKVLADDTELEQHVEVVGIQGPGPIGFYTSKAYKLSHLEKLVADDPENRKLEPNGNVRLLDRMQGMIDGIEDAAEDLREGE